MNGAGRSPEVGVREAAGASAHAAVAGSGADILVAEDSATQAEELRQLLEGHDFAVTVAGDGRRALAAARARRPALVISDIVMPEMDGYALCREIKSDERLKDVPVILLTVLSSPHDILKGLESGADNFITKPYREQNLLSLVGFVLANRESRRTERAQMGMEIVFGGRKYFITSERQQILDLLLSTYSTAVERNDDLVRAQKELRALNEELEARVARRTASLTAEIGERRRAESERRQYHDKLRTSLEDTIRAVAATVEMRDPYTAGHQRRVADLASAIARELALPDEQIHGLYLAGIVHDLGKIHIPAEILSKPGRLSEHEYRLIQAHPEVGHGILKDIDFPWPIAQIVLEHHERFDGSGYPRGLGDGDILLEARILAVADVVEAMSSHRPYRAGLGIDKALAQIRERRGTHFDARAVDACLALFEQRKFAFDQSCVSDRP